MRSWHSDDKENVYSFCNYSRIFAQFSASAHIRDRGRPAAYQLRHVCCIIGVLGRVIRK